MCVSCLCDVLTLGQLCSMGHSNVLSVAGLKFKTQFKIGSPASLKAKCKEQE